MANRFISKALHILGIEDDDRPVQQTASRAYAEQQTRRAANTYVPQNNRTEEMRRRTMVPDKQVRGYARDYTERGGAYSTRTYTPSPSDQYDRGYDAAASTSAPRQREYAREDAYDRAPVYDERPERRAAPKPQSRTTRPAQQRQPAQRQQQPAPAGGPAVWTKYTLHRLEECSAVVDSLIAGEIVLIMLDYLDPVMSQRVVDTLSGAAFALKSRIQRASDTAYLITPKNVSFRTNRYDTYSRRYTENE